MKNNILVRGLVFTLGLLGTQAALATDLDLTILSAGSPVVQVLPGDPVNYTITGELTDAANLGLAMFAFDLTYDGGSLSPASAGPSMAPFVTPLGLNNPAGFGGTPQGGDLLQIGGAQNTIVNTFASKPIGPVQTGIALPGSPVTLAQGVLMAPSQPGTYSLRATHLFANVIDPSTTGNPFWRVLPCAEGPLSELVIIVGDCAPELVCTGKPNSLGCVPRMVWSGEASLSSSTGLALGVLRVLNEEFGAWAWSTSAGTPNPLGNSLCIGGPVQIEAISG
ncbi:MAG TPA: hypothetical protein P5218_05075, partial [Planctomycetota bacterium]|nr:hypothetical protein [Planctomycetota bacterium]